MWLSGMSKEAVEKEIEKEVGTIGQQLERPEICDHHKTDVENGLTEGETQKKKKITKITKITK